MTETSSATPNQTTATVSPFSLPEPWELVADGYADELDLLMRNFSLSAAELLNPARDAIVIDVATGPGTLSLDLAPRVQRIDAIDFSPRMLERLRAAARARNLANIQATHADGQALPFANDSYDAGFSLFGLMFFPDRPRGYAELLRVLRPGRRALISSWAPVEESSLMTLMFGAIAALDPNFTAPRKSAAGLENPEVLAAELSQAGFRDVSVSKVTHGAHVRDSADLWARMERGSAPMVMMRRRMGEAVFNQRLPLALAYLEQNLDKVGELTSSAWFAVGSKP